jgi:hypothetical protein
MGHADDLSDWDTVVFCDQDEVSGTGDPSAYADALFGVERPRLIGTLNLAFHIESRRATAVDIELMGPSTRRRREQETLAEWAHQLQHAVALCDAVGIGAPTSLTSPPAVDTLVQRGESAETREYQRDRAKDHLHARPRGLKSMHTAGWVSTDQSDDRPLGQGDQRRRVGARLQRGILPYPATGT